MPKPAGPPAENVEGTVKKVADGGLIVISIGSDAGLQKGNTLEVFRLGPKPADAKYLGRVRVLEVTATEAVCQPTDKLKDPIEVGDRVASRILKE